MKKKNKKPISIQTYPNTNKPEWIKVGIKVECWGEGMGKSFIVEEIDDKNCRVRLDNGCWESWEKIYLPEKM